jgi:hypothetical protein
MLPEISAGVISPIINSIVEIPHKSIQMPDFTYVVANLPHPKKINK